MFPSRIDVAGDQGLAVELDWRHGMPTRIADSDGVVDRPRRPARRHDRRGHQRCRRRRRRYDVDATGAVVAVHHPDGRVVRYERDDAGRLTAVVNAAGAARRDPLHGGRPHSVRASTPTAPSTSVDYDAAGLPSRIVAADGVATDVLVDDKQRIVGARFANGDAIGPGARRVRSPDRRRRQRRSLGDGARPGRPHRQADRSDRRASSPRSTATSAVGCRSPTPPGSPGGWSATSSIACAR